MVLFTVNDILSSACSCAQVLVAVFLFAWTLPRKEPIAARTVAALLFFIAWVAIATVAVPFSLNSNAWGLLALTWSIMLINSFVMVLLVFDASIAAALFCSSAGYTLQNLVSGLGSTESELFSLATNTPLDIFVNMVVPYLVVYTLAYVFFIKRIRRDGLELMQPQAMFGMLLVVIFAVIAYDVVVKQMFSLGLPTSILVAVRLSHSALCIFILALEYEFLYSRTLRKEVLTTEQTMQRQREQYELSRETIDAINIKCHDIRHQIRTLASGNASVDPAVLAEIEQSVSVYDSGVHTGNEPLDLILSEKGLICNREHISLACIADGQALNFMTPADIYALMGNALDNAIEATKQVTDTGRKSISVGIRRVGDTAVIHVENYFEGKLEFTGDLPQTTKPDKQNHGFGVKSMKNIAERYGGALHTRAQDNVFHLNITMPIQEND